MKYSVYRPSRVFMNSLNNNEENLKLHRDRQFVFGEYIERAAAANRELLNRGILSVAAIVEANDLGDLFEKTNSSYSSWLENKDVTLVEGYVRLFTNSSSAGDIMQDENGIFWMYAGEGYVELEMN